MSDVELVRYAEAMIKIGEGNDLLIAELGRTYLATSKRLADLARDAFGYAGEDPIGALELGVVRLQAAAEAMRVCIVYARDRRGGAFDFDTWINLVESALGAGVLPPHAIEEAQGETLKYREALSNVRAERDAMAEIVAASTVLRRRHPDIFDNSKPETDTGRWRDAVDKFHKERGR